MLNSNDLDSKTWAETRCFSPEAEGENLNTINTTGCNTTKKHLKELLKLQKKLKS